MPKNFPAKLIVYTDGGSRGNPGPSALGVVVQNENGEMLKSYNAFLGTRTNNEAEYEAVLFALKKIKALWGGEAASRMHLEVRMDSKLLVEQLSDRYKITQDHIGKLYLAVRNLKLDFGSITFTHIPREKNTDADRQVNEALDAEEQQTPLLGI